MGHKYDPLSHLKDVSLRFDILMRMSGLKNIVEVFQFVANKHDYSDRAEKALADYHWFTEDDEIGDDFGLNDNKQHKQEKRRADRKRQKLKRLRTKVGSGLTDDALSVICEAFGILPKYFRHPDPRQLAIALDQKQSGRGHAWRRNGNSLEEVLSFVDIHQAQHPGSISSLSRYSTMFANFEARPWLATGHSHLPGEDVLLSGTLPKAIKSMLVDCESLPLSKEGKWEIRELGVVSSSRNFVVRQGAECCLLRIYTRLFEEEVYEVHKRERHVSSLTARDDCQMPLVDYVKPLELNSEDKTSDLVPKELHEKLGLSGERHPFALYRFIEGQVHLGREAIAEYNINVQTAAVSLCEQLARLHNHVAGFELNEDLPKLQPPGYVDRKLTPLVDAYSKIFSAAHTGKDHEFSEVWNSNLEVIKIAAHEYDIWLEDMRNHRELQPPVLYDLHPFNAFFNPATSECSLILDYECLTRRWSIEDVVSYAIHRFSREIVAAHSDIPDAQRGDNAKEIAADMATAYASIDCRTTASNLMDGLAARIRITNIGKLLNNVHNLVRGIDPTGRPSRTHDTEAMKFLSHLEESRYYD